MSNDPKKITDFGPLVLTEDGSYTVKHLGHGQDFHTTEGARFEAWQLYVVASGLLEALTNKVTIPVLDVGMGLGYNACATIAAWLESQGSCDLRLVSLEIDGKLVEALAGGAAPWCEGWSPNWLAGPLVLNSVRPNEWVARVIHPCTDRVLEWMVLIGDGAQIEIPSVSGGYQFVWQDPFTPELNPHMWSAQWFKKVKQVAAIEARLMTYSVSRVVRDALQEASWSVERFPTPGKKRHWLRAIPSSHE